MGLLLLRAREGVRQGLGNLTDRAEVSPFRMLTEEPRYDFLHLLGSHAWRVA
jgi:hypothetical protein